MINKPLKPFGKFYNVIGNLPSSYLTALSYEEQLIIIGKKIDEIIQFINNILEEKISDYIIELFNDIMLDTMYESETETLILFLTENN